MQVFVCKSFETYGNKKQLKEKADKTYKNLHKRGKKLQKKRNWSSKNNKKQKSGNVSSQRYKEPPLATKKGP